MKKMKKRNAIILIVALLIVGIAVGYAALSQTLTINGTANITTDWDVEITGITAAAGNAATGATDAAAPTFTADSATFNVNLAYPGATATYTVDIENKGNINAVLESITGVSEANEAEPTSVTYEVTGVSTNDTLNAGAEATATVKVTWDADDTTIPTTTTKTATIVLKYVQAD